jgi:thiol:disulfide interchange protein
MRQLPRILLALFLLAAPVSARTPELADVWNGAEIAWRDIGSGIKEATRTGKPVIMLMHASWCPSCKRYREVFKDRGVVEAARAFVMILIDVDKDPDANSAFSPDGTYVPRTIFMDAEGNIQSSIKGADPEYPHSIDIDGPGELFSLMQKAKALLATEPRRASD